MQEDTIHKYYLGWTEDLTLGILRTILNKLGYLAQYF